MKKLFFLITFLFAFDSKVIPFDEIDLKSAVSGKVVQVNKTFEAKYIKDKLILKIDDTQEKINLENLKNNLEILKQQIDNLKQIVDKKRDIYQRYKILKTKSQTEKDLKFFDYISSLNQLLSLKTQYQNTLANIKKTQDLINKKNIKANGYVYKIFVNKGDYVTPGRLIAKIYDISKQKLIIYVPVDFNLTNKKVFINGKESNFKIYKVWNIPDTQYITSYKVELVGDGLKFGEIVKVELK